MGPGDIYTLGTSSYTVPFHRCIGISVYIPCPLLVPPIDINEYSILLIHVSIAGGLTVGVHVYPWWGSVSVPVRESDPLNDISNGITGGHQHTRTLPP